MQSHPYRDQTPKHETVRRGASSWIDAHDGSVDKQRTSNAAQRETQQPCSSLLRLEALFSLLEANEEHINYSPYRSLDAGTASTFLGTFVKTIESTFNCEQK